MPPNIFFLFKNSFFWIFSLRQTNKKYKNFQNDYLGAVKTEKIEKLAFYGTQNTEISVPNAHGRF